MIPVYVQTREQADYSSVEADGYEVVRRRDRLNLLEGPSGRAAAGESDLVRQFASHLRGIEDEVQGYLTRRLDEWTWASWQGFFGRLQHELGTGAWLPVSNPRGAFLAFHWHWRTGPKAEEYLQLENDRLCHKVHVPVDEGRRETREAAHARFVAEAAPRGLTGTTTRYRSGQWMTASVFERDYRVPDDEGKLDLSATLAVLASAQETLDAACASLEA